MGRGLFPLLVGALAATGLMLSTATMADEGATPSTGAAVVTSQEAARPLSFHDLSPRRTHLHSAPRPQFGRTPIRGHGDAFVFASMEGAHRSGMDARRSQARARMGRDAR